MACLVFWLAAIAWADMHPIVRHRRLPRMPGPVLGGMHLAEGGRSVAPNRDAPAVLSDVVTAGSGAEAGAPAHDMAAAGPPGERVPAGAAPGTGNEPGVVRPWVPGQRPGEERQAQPGAAATAEHSMPVPPAQRSGEADRPEHSLTGPGTVSQPGRAAGGDAGR